MDSPKYWNMLTDTQKQWINDYLEHRVSGLPIVVEGTVRANRALIERRREEIRNEMGLIFFRIICGRLDINYKDVTAEDIDTNVFDVVDFGPNDVLRIQKGFSKYQFYLKCAALKPLLFYVLMRKEHMALDDADSETEFASIKKRLNAAIGMMPTDPPSHIRNASTGYKKVFLTREQLVQAYRDLMVSHQYENFFAQLQFITAFMLFMLLGVRKIELRHLRIEHFDLDGMGYIRQNDAGWGVARIVVSKGDYSPSHPEYGTLIVPHLVRLLNKYLEELYKVSPVKGKGYLFRRRKFDPDSQYSSRTVGYWFESARGRLDTLSDIQRQYLSTHDGRHTMNQLVTKAIIPRRLGPYQQRAAQLQIRHDIFRKNGTTGQNNYEDEIPFDAYLKIIDQSLNFPWNLEELQEWERRMGYYDDDVVEADAAPVGLQFVDKPKTETTSLSAANLEEIKALSDVSLDEAAAELKMLLKKAPKGWTTKQRFLRIQELQRVVAQGEVSI